MAMVASCEPTANQSGQLLKTLVGLFFISESDDGMKAMLYDSAY